MLVEAKKLVLKEVADVLENISHAVNANRSSFFLRDQQTDTLYALVAQGVEGSVISVPVGRGIVGYVAATGRSQLINDAQQSPLLDKSHDQRLGFTTRTVLCVPVLGDEREVLGVIQVINKQEGLFTDRDLQILTSLAATISLVIKNVQLYETAKRGREDISTLLDISSALSSELDLDNLIRLIMNKASQITCADRSSLFLLDASRQELWTKYAKGLGDKMIRVPIGKGIVGMVAESKEPYITNEAYENPFFDSSADEKTGYRTQSILSVPVLNGNRQLQGVIQVVNKQGGDFSMQDLRILNGFAAQTSIAIENAKLFEEINRMRNYLDDLVQNLNSGIITIDEEGIIQTVNKSLCHMLDVSAEELVGQHYQKLADEYEPIFQSQEKVVRTGKKHEEYNIVTSLADNRRLIFNLNALPMQDAKGGNIGAVSVLDDITQERRIKENLSRYLPQHLIKEVMNKDDLSLLNGRSQQCSILFSDIRGFTTLTEQLGAREIVALLNEYFHLMVDEIYKQSGILDKFIGDAIMAVFGIPYAKPQDPAQAVRAALGMFDRLAQFNKRRMSQRKLPLRIGVGISTGQVVSGNIGSEKRLEYTVIGDPVNLASRLEGTTKKYGVDVLICETTYAQIRDEFFCREVDAIRVKGKKQSTHIYSVLGPKEQPLQERDEAFLTMYLTALAHYRNRDFAKARSAFTSAANINLKDIPTHLFLNRCKHFLKNPPAPDWDGVWRMNAK